MHKNVTRTETPFEIRSIRMKLSFGRAIRPSDKTKEEKLSFGRAIGPSDETFGLQKWLI